MREKKLTFGEMTSVTLIWSSLNGNLEIAQYLVDQGASLDKTDNYGYTPHMTAAAYGHFE